MKITVTAEDIALGLPGSCSHCPVAMAIARDTGSRGVRVDGVEIFVCDRRFSAPPSVSNFINHFDDWDSEALPPEPFPPQPFTFELPI